MGERVRARRKHRGIGQKELADALGITFQQVQKYERGHNRVSASMLYGIARALRTPIPYFFEGLEPIESVSSADEDERLLWEFLASGEGKELAQAFPRISDRPLRRSVLDLVRAAVEAELD